jgi:hypothetical protein
MWEKQRWSLWEIESGSEDLLCVDLKDFLPSFLGEICLGFSSNLVDVSEIVDGIVQ